MRKYIVVIPNQLNIKNNKIDKDNFEKHKKIIQGTLQQCFEEKNYKTKFSTNSIFKKLNQQKQFWKKKTILDKKPKIKKMKKMRKKTCGER